MKFKNLKVENLEAFFKVVDQCEGSVYLISPDMNINLKSKIAQYISLANLCSAGTGVIDEVEIVANNRSDIDRLINFMIEGHKA